MNNTNLIILFRRFYITLVCICITSICLFSQELLTDEALNAFKYLNEVRSNPAAYSKEIGVDLGYVERLPPLAWSNELASAAEKKALDMAKRDYFEHVDPDGYGMNYWISKAGYSLPDEWLKKKSYNNFESLQAGLSTGIEVIRSLILDEGTNPPGHRNHLLGIMPFWANCTDIGIGIAYNEDAEYSYYTCILVAKHNY